MTIHKSMMAAILILESAERTFWASFMRERISPVLRVSKNLTGNEKMCLKYEKRR